MSARILETLLRRRLFGPADTTKAIPLPDRGYKIIGDGKIIWAKPKRKAKKAKGRR